MGLERLPETAYPACVMRTTCSANSETTYIASRTFVPWSSFRYHLESGKDPREHGSTLSTAHERSRPRSPFPRHSRQQ